MYDFAPHRSAATQPAVSDTPVDFEEDGWLGTAYGMTMPAPFEPTPALAPFEERLGGLAVREVRELEVFRLFFDNEKKSRY